MVDGVPGMASARTRPVGRSKQQGSGYALDACFGCKEHPRAILDELHWSVDPAYCGSIKPAKRLGAAYERIGDADRTAFIDISKLDGRAEQP